MACIEALATMSCPRCFVEQGEIGPPMQAESTDAEQVRISLPECRRVVVKIGSRALTASPERYVQLARQLAEQQRAGRSMVLVSSGAIALGRVRLGFDERPRSIYRLQAAAAAGQSLLMRAYEDAFESQGVHVAQVLLTHADLADRERFLNARRAIEALWELDVVPIINENDTVAVEELCFGDNDQLAAMTANLVGADLLIILSDVEGVLDHRDERISFAHDATELKRFIREQSDDLSLGGMGSKVEAAHRAALQGVPVVIASAAAPELVAAVLGGEDRGTLVLPHGSPLASRKHWIAYTLKPKGDVEVDEGACRAIREKNSSLLAAGITRVSGSFEIGDAVRILDPKSKEIARGLARYRSAEVERIRGRRSKDIAERVDKHQGDAIVHRDDLVLV